MDAADAERCGRCGTLAGASDLVVHSNLERVRNRRDGAPAEPEPGYLKAELVERSPRWSVFLVERRLCAACLAQTQEDAEEQDGRMRRLTLGAAIVALAVGAAALAFPTLWPDLERRLDLKTHSDAKPGSSASAPAATPYKPPFPASMPTGR